MTKVIKGKGIKEASDSELVIQGVESCTPTALVGLTPLLRELEFKRVTSHDQLNIGDGSNTVAIHHSPAGRIVGELGAPASVIVVDISLTGCSAHTSLPTSLKESPLARSLVSNYADSNGALIVSNTQRVIGCYNSGLNLLTLSDVTHDYLGIPKLGEILRQLKCYKDHFGMLGIAEPVKKGKVTLLFPKISNKLIIGLDPELTLLDKAGVVHSSPFGCGDCDAEIGSDGGSVEIRPKPGTPKQVVKTVKSLYERMDSKLDKDLRLFSSGGGFVKRPLGGHIHFNIPINLELTALLDDFIGKPMKRMNGSSRSEGSGYGKLSEVKRQPHGFEYRTPPSFVGKPDLFAGVIALAYCVASTWKTISNSGITFEYGCGDITGAFKSAYEKLTYYKTYKKEIEDFLSYVYDEEKTIEEFDVLAAWAVRDAIVLEDITI